MSSRRRVAGREHQGVGQDAGDIGQPQGRHALTKLGVRAVAGVHQHNASRQPRLAGPADLLKRDLRLGRKADLVWNLGLAPPLAVLGPGLRQIEPKGRRQARPRVGQGQADRHLAVVLLADLPAVLTRHPHRMMALLAERRVVDDPRLDRPMRLDRRQHQLAHLGQHHLVRPRRLADEVHQRLMLGRHPRGRRHRRQRLHALALHRQHQPRAVVAKRAYPVGVADHAPQTFHIGRKPRLHRVRHPHSPGNPKRIAKRESSTRLGGCDRLTQ